MTYEEALQAVSALAPRGWRLGLDRMQAFVERAGLSDAMGERPGPHYVHVAGTNGKGSTTAMLQSLMIAQGYRTGAFFSPYVYDPRERVQIGRELIEPGVFARWVEYLLRVAEQMDETEFGGITEFEMKTAVGFATWKEAGCEWVALEVGLGGRLDATTVVTPRSGIVVSIGWDHMHILGDTLEKIAAEKAGIAKPGMPLVVGAMEPGPRDVIHRIAQEVGSPVWQFGEEVRLEAVGDRFRVHTPGASYGPMRPNLIGVHQPHNMALAVAAMEAAGALRDPDAVVKGIEEARIPGRFEQRTVGGVSVVLDGAHNLDSAQALARSLEAQYPGRRLIALCGMLQGHEPAPFFECFRHLFQKVHLSRIDFHRTREPDDLAEEIMGIFPSVVAHGDPDEALQAALKSAGHDGILVVTGSFYLVGETGNRLDHLG